MGNGWEAQVEGVRVTVSGVLRLSSPRAYDEVFAPVVERLEGSDPVEVDLRLVEFMNSSGISAFAQLVLKARRAVRPLTVIVDDDVAWQRKAVKTLAKLYPGMEVSAA